MLFRYRYFLLVSYFLFINFLFFMPGSALPKTTWLDQIFFDKWVHIGLFLLLAYLSGNALQRNDKRVKFAIFLSAVVYGILIEIIQERFVPNRSLDLGDWAADIAGSFLGIWLWNLRFISLPVKK